MFEFEIECVADAHAALVAQKQFKRDNDRAATEAIQGKLADVHAHLLANHEHAVQCKLADPEQAEYQEWYYAVCAEYDKAQAASARQREVAMKKLEAIVVASRRRRVA